MPKIVFDDIDEPVIPDNYYPVNLEDLQLGDKAIVRSTYGHFREGIVVIYPHRGEGGWVLHGDDDPEGHGSYIKEETYPNNWCHDFWNGVWKYDDKFKPGENCLF